MSDYLTEPDLSRREFVHRTPYTDVYRVVADFGQFSKEYWVNQTGGRAGIVVVQDNKVLLVRQYRLLINGLSWEIPSGGLNDSETAAEAAIRECCEETGWLCTEVEPLLAYYPGLDTSDCPQHLFYSTAGAEGPDPWMADPREIQHREWVPLDRCLNMVFTGAIQDGFTVTGLLAYNGFAKNRD